MRMWFVVVLALASCKKDDAKPAAAPAGSGSAVAPAAATQVDVYVDDQAVAHIPLAALQSWPRVDQLLPTNARRLGTWDDVFIKGSSPKPAQLHRPSDTYPQLVPALFVAEDKTPSFGMFDPVELAKHGKPEVVENGVSEVRIKLQQGGGRGEHDQSDGVAADPAQMKIAVKTPKGQSTLDGAKLLAVAREPMPGADGEARGWTLATLLKTAGIEKFEKISLSDATGLNLVLEKADFTGDSIPYVKLNRQGSLRLQVYKKAGTGWQRSGDLRGLVAVEVLK
jgi:hypothetical protein